MARWPFWPHAFPGSKWSYAGLVFIYTGAIGSRLAVGDPAVTLVGPIIFTALVAASWALRPSARRALVSQREDNRKIHIYGYIFSSPNEETLMKKTILFMSIICASGLTMVSIYNTIVDAKSWGSDIPTSIQTARDYYRHVDPSFYAIAGPVNLILILLTLILFWKDSVSSAFTLASLVLYVAILILTLAYFVPRDLILFTWSIPDHLEQIRAASAQWSHMNWLRSLLGLAGVLISFKGLDTYYSIRGKVGA